MTDRQPVSKKTRFEVFKRDKFTCQYCGKKAPDVILHADHIKPVAEGGLSDLLNLVTSCADCNGGKGARLLSDSSVVEKQRAQIEELEERRQQLEMMLEWREELSKFNGQVEEVVANHIQSLTRFRPNENGMIHVKKWLKAFPLETILNASEEAFVRCGVYANGKMTDASWEDGFRKIAPYCQSQLKYGAGPEVSQLAYIQGIVRKRIGDRYFKCMDELKEMFDAGNTIEDIQRAAKSVDDEEDFSIWHYRWTHPK